jgi:hypothetical protein
MDRSSDSPQHPSPPEARCLSLLPEEGALTPLTQPVRTPSPPTQAPGIAGVLGCDMSLASPVIHTARCLSPIGIAGVTFSPAWMVLYSPTLLPNPVVPRPAAGIACGLRGDTRHLREDDRAQDRHAAGARSNRHGHGSGTTATFTAPAQPPRRRHCQMFMAQRSYGQA